MRLLTTAGGNMEAASTPASMVTTSEYVAIHDDDDQGLSLEPFAALKRVARLCTTRIVER